MSLAWMNGRGDVERLLLELLARARSTAHATTIGCRGIHPLPDSSLISFVNRK